MGLLGNLSEKNRTCIDMSRVCCQQKAASTQQVIITNCTKRTFDADKINLKILAHRWHYLGSKGIMTIFCNPSVSAYIFHCVQLCVKNVFITVLGNTCPRKYRQMKAQGVFRITNFGRKEKRNKHLWNLSVIAWVFFAWYLCLKIKVPVDKGKSHLTDRIPEWLKTGICSL